MDESGGGIIASIMMLVWLAVIVAILAGFWKVFVKAGQPGWACLVPIYNIVVMLQIVGRPIWWLVLLLIPIVSLVVMIIVSIDMAKSFGKGTGFGVGLALLGPIFYPMLGFGDAKYQGPAAATAS
ncbi:MAG: signal peptidase I [Xanthomonadales bacterium]|nr:signal peptidase I [Xanthomonadales bacterium]MBK7144659.1 signal peptidase I [Xanthomonadales bacterium]MCC6561767.1 signal peptidase I [Xanthomonadales bacterium]